MLKLKLSSWQQLHSFLYFAVACEQVKERGTGKREPVGETKDFTFQMPVIYVRFILTIQVASTRRTANFE